MRNDFKRKLTSMCFMIFPSLSFAGNDSVSFTDALTHFLDYLTGPVGQAVALLAIVGVGYGCFVLGKLSKGAACTTVLGIGIVFGAHGLLGVLTGGA
mgnify:CR=1 FL=1